MTTGDPMCPICGMYVVQGACNCKLQQDLNNTIPGWQPIIQPQITNPIFIPTITTSNIGAYPLGETINTFELADYKTGTILKTSKEVQLVNVKTYLEVTIEEIYLNRFYKHHIMLLEDATDQSTYGGKKWLMVSPLIFRLTIYRKDKSGVHFVTLINVRDFWTTPTETVFGAQLMEIRDNIKLCKLVEKDEMFRKFNKEMKY